MSWSKVQICNMALAKAGISQTINSLDVTPGTAGAQEVLACAQYWDLAFEATARSCNWACLTVGPVALSGAVGATVLEGYSYVYQLPADYLGWPEYHDAQTAARRIGRQLHTDRAVTQFLYVARTEDTDRFDPLFVASLVLQLAAWLSHGPVAGENENKAQALEMWFERVCLPLAMFVNSTEVGSGALQQKTWIDARK